MHMKSKKQLYTCLTLEGKVLSLKSLNFDTFHTWLSIAQIYLPPYGECSVKFMQ